MPARSSLRPWMLLAATLGWLWANSVFAPWAADRAPRLWLYDLLFYLRFALLAWAAVEVLRFALRRTAPRPAEAAALVSVALVLLAAQAYQHTEAGVRWKLAASHDALLAVAGAGHDDQRRRAGHFLVDGVRTPCGAAWLWLGRPFGGGTGINLALVHAGERAPATPFAEAFVFWHAADGWWLAYQQGDRYRRAVQRVNSERPACRAGMVVQRHRHGQAFIAAE